MVHKCCESIHFKS